MFSVEKVRGHIGTVRSRLPQIEWLPLAVLLLAAFGVWAFVELADEVMEGDSQAFDRRVLLAMRSADDLSDPIGPRWFEEFMRDVTALGSVGVLAAVVVASCGYLWLLKKRMAVVYLLVAVLGAQAVSSTAKGYFDRPRPDLAPHGTYVYTASFPSGHSIMSTATYLTLGALLARYQPTRWLRLYLIAFAILIALFVGVSRVYLSVHWPTDVLAGWAVGAAWALFCWAIAIYLQRRGAIEGRRGSPEIAADISDV